MPAVADPPFHYGGLRRSITEQEELTDYPPPVIELFHVEQSLRMPDSLELDETVDFYP